MHGFPEGAAMLAERSSADLRSREARRAAAEAADERAAAITAAFASSSLHDPRRPVLRDRAITAWAPLAYRLARRYASRPETLEDVQQTAMIGLIKAVDRFESDRGVDFTAYAIPTIVGELKRYFRDQGWALHVPRRLHDLYMAISEANTRLIQCLERKPTVTDIATDLKISEEEVLEGLEAAYAFRSESLSTPKSADGQKELADTLGAEEYGYDFTEWHQDLREAVTALTERERRILHLRFYGELTQIQIAEQIGLSQMHVSRLLAATIAKLHRHLLQT
jgi:RNA polymerase sigma-B factor